MTIFWDVSTRRYWRLKRMTSLLPSKTRETPHPCIIVASECIKSLSVLTLYTASLRQVPLYRHFEILALIWELSTCYTFHHRVLHALFAFFWCEGREKESQYTSRRRYGTGIVRKGEWEGKRKEGEKWKSKDFSANRIRDGTLKDNENEKRQNGKHRVLVKHGNRRITCWWNIID